MAKKPNIDLNSDKMRDYGDSTPFLPFGDGKYRVRLDVVLFHEGFRGDAYRAKVEVLESDRDDVKVGYQYCIHFPLDSDKLVQEIKMKQLRSFVAAAFGADPRDEGFDANDALKTLIELSDAEALKGEDMQVEIVCRDKQQVDKKTKELLTNKDGSPKMVTNQFYNSIEKAA